MLRSAVLVAGLPACPVVGTWVRAVPGYLRRAGVLAGVVAQGIHGAADGKVPSGTRGARQVWGSGMGCPVGFGAPWDGAPRGRATGLRAKGCIYGSVNSFAANPAGVYKC